MCGGGKQGTSSQGQSGSVSGAPQAEAMAAESWARAEGASTLPFQNYGGEFVAPINQQQTTGIQGINNTAGTYAPYGNAATSTLGQGLSAGQRLTGAGVGLTAANAQLDPNNINRWMSPYIGDVVQATENQQQQQNQIQQSQLQGNAIQAGAFGGDRGGVAAANLAYQQNLANQPVIANLYNQGFSQALGEANTQQQMGLGAGAQLGQLGNQFFNQGLSGAQGYAGLGTQAQTNQLGVANAQVGAGTLQQQTQQAQDQALYNQFLQRQAFPFQTSQFLTNAASQLAPIYGTQSQSYGTSSQPTSFFRRGGAVDLEMGDDGVYRPHKAGGGGLSDDALASLIAAHGQMYAPHAGAGSEQGPYGAGLSAGHGTSMPTMQLPSMGGQRQGNTGVGHSMDSLNRMADFGKNVAGAYSLGKEGLVGARATKDKNGNITPATGGLFGHGGVWGASAPSVPGAAGTTQGQTVAGAPAPDVIPNPFNDPTLPDGTPISDEVYARGGRAGFAGGGGLSDATLQSIFADVIGHHRQPAAKKPDSPWLPNVNRGRMALGLHPKAEPVVVAATPPPLPAYEQPGGRDLLPEFSTYQSRPTPAAAAPVPAPVAYRPHPVLSAPNDAAYVPPPSTGISAAPAPHAGGFWDKIQEALKARDVSLPDRMAQGQELEAAASGGRVGLAYGGIPYAGGISEAYLPSDLGDPISIGNPAEEAMMRGQQGSAPGGQMSSGLGAGLKGLGQIASIASMFMKDGGRIGKEGGGGLSDAVPAVPADDTFDKMLTVESGNRHFDGKGNVITSPKGARGIAQVMPETGPEAARLAGIPWNPELFNRGRTGDPAKDKEAEDYSRTLGSAYHGEQKKQFGDPLIAAAAYNAGPEAVRGAIEKAKKNGGNYLDFLPKETQAYVQKVGGGGQASGNADAVLASQASSMPVNATADKPNWWNRESGGLSGTERGVISLLTGLGGMASSPSRFFGGALLSGLGAGANTYGQLGLKGKQLDIEQQGMGIKQTQNNLQLYNQLRVLAAAAQRNGQGVPQWISDQLTSLASQLYGNPSAAKLDTPGLTPTSGGGLSGGTPYTPTQSAAPPTPPVTITPVGPIAQPPAQGDAAPASGGVPQVNLQDPSFTSKLPNEMNPAWLMERSRELGGLGDAAGADKMRNESQALAERYIKEGRAITPDGKVIPVPGWAETEAWKQRVPENQKWMDDQAMGAFGRAQARQQLDEIRKIMETYETGSFNDVKAEAQALGRALGIPIDNRATMNAEAYQTFMKNALQNVFANVKDMGGKPLVSEIQGFTKSTANPDLQPGANRKVLAELYGKLDHQDKMYGDIVNTLDKAPGANKATLMQNWLANKENNIGKFQEERLKDIAVRGYHPPVSEVKPGESIIVEPGQEKTYNLPDNYLKDHGPIKLRRTQRPDGTLGWSPVR